MNVTDPIADLLTRLRNAQTARHETVLIPASRLKIMIVDLLFREGFVRAYKCVRDSRQGLIKVAIAYQGGDRPVPVIRSLERISRPGRRVYLGAEQLPYVKNGYGVALLSTSLGVMTCREARKRHVGGEYLCRVY